MSAVDMRRAIIQVRAPRSVLRARHYSLLAYWTRIESRRVEEGRRGSAWWRDTAQGRSLEDGLYKQPAYPLTYGVACHGFSTERVRIREAPGTAFDYRELAKEKVA